MKLAPGAGNARRGFTLIELLVVIAIIAIIMGLLVGVVVRTLNMREDISNRDDLDKLSAALEKFKSKYGVYPPSSVLLSRDPAQYNPATATALGKRSAKILQQIWPKIDLQNPPDWSGGTMPNPNNYTVTLEGDQCLVFFLGGIPNANPPGCRGFADSLTNPTNLANTSKVQPFFNFLSDRLFKRSASHTFYSYRDAYGGGPFAYFAAVGKNSYVDTDCAGLGVSPFYETAAPFRKYVNPDSFQIISSGRDKRFGAGGGPWNRSSPNITGIGSDDMSSFHSTYLGNAE